MRDAVVHYYRRPRPDPVVAPPPVLPAPVVHASCDDGGCACNDCSTEPALDADLAVPQVIDIVPSAVDDEPTTIARRQSFAGNATAYAFPITSIESEECIRLQTRVDAVDDVTGGGFAKGGIHLLGGDPGAGKSTLMLQMASGFVQQGKTVLYISAEEALQRVKQRATRLSVLHDRLLITTNNEVEQVVEALNETNADVLIVDSAQRLFSTKLRTQPGSPTQLRFCLEHLSNQVANHHVLLLACHVTKSGGLAGPKTLEHLVDVVLHLRRDGDDVRTLSTTKNRFGPNLCRELWMTNDGFRCEPAVPSGNATLPTQRAALGTSSTTTTLAKTLQDHLLRPVCQVVEPQALPDEDQRWAVLHGDALQLLGCLPPDSVDGVITDPPYGSGTDHFVGDAKDQHSHLTWSALWMVSAFRAAKVGAPICVFAQWKGLSVVVDAMQAAGWAHRGIAVWDKTAGGARPQRGRFRDQADFIVWGSKGKMLSQNVYVDGVIRQAPPRSRVGGHPTVKPTELMQQLVELVREDGVVLDPFCGSGTTLEAALLQNRRALGVELDAAFVAAVKERCAVAGGGASEVISTRPQRGQTEEGSWRT